MQPLPLDALRDPAFEALYVNQGITTFNPIQTQVRLVVAFQANLVARQQIPHSGGVQLLCLQKSVHSCISAELAKLQQRCIRPCNMRSNTLGPEPGIVLVIL